MKRERERGKVRNVLFLNDYGPGVVERNDSIDGLDELPGEWRLLQLFCLTVRGHLLQYAPLRD